jgi:hypothetical protein
MPLAELAKVAGQTQRVVARIAEGMVDDRGTGRLHQNVTNATTLSLIGLRSGSTVLDIALPQPALDQLPADGMPAELGEMAVTVLVESLEILSEDDLQPVLPVGVDDITVRDIDVWLRALRSYSRISIDAELSRSALRAEITPREARAKLRNAASQPSITYVSASHQAVTGKLYAVNLRTGSFRIEDDAGHSIRLNVSEEIRDEVAQLINRRVRAYGKASLDSRHRLVSFDVDGLEEAPELMIDQGAFFEKHELVAPSRSITQAELEVGVISDLSDDEIDAFLSALETD